jgi:sugar phosphate isomerase/epimerase
MMRTLTFGFLNLNTQAGGIASPYETVASAVDAGFNSVGLRVAGRRVEDPFHEFVGSGARIAALRQFASDRGARISSVTGYGFYPDLDLAHHQRVLDTAAELGCGLMLLNVYHEDMLEFSDALARLGECAAGFAVRVAVEFMPFSGLRNLQEADRAIDRARGDNLGHVIDALHLMRSGGCPADLRAVDPRRIFMGQLCDAKRRNVPPSDDELRAEARAHREFPGEGDAPLHDLLSALPEGIEIEIEVPRSDFGSLSFSERARAIGSRFRQYMQEHDQRAG